jgi:hypothetical protein
MFPITWVLQFKTPGVQGLTPKFVPGSQGRRIQTGRDDAATTIDRITDQGMTEVPHMHADLVRATAGQTQPQQGMPGKTLEQAVVGTCPAAIVAYRHAQAILRVATNGHLNTSAPGHRPLNQSNVLPVHTPLGQLLNEILTGMFALGDHQKAAGVFIQAMDDPCAWQVRISGTVRKYRIGQGALRVTRARVGKHAGGLIDDQNLRIFVYDAQWYRFGQPVFRLSWRNQHPYRFPAPDAQAGAGMLSVDLDLTGLQQFLDAATAELRQQLGQEAVETFTAPLLWQK